MFSFNVVLNQSQEICFFNLSTVCYVGFEINTIVPTFWFIFLFLFFIKCTSHYNALETQHALRHVKTI